MRVSGFGASAGQGSAYTHPNHPRYQLRYTRYQLRYTRILNFASADDIITQIQGVKHP